MNWQPIETAPRDGQSIEVAWIVNPPTVEQVLITYWQAGKWHGHWTPTHWRPVTGRDDLREARRYRNHIRQMPRDR